MKHISSIRILLLKWLMVPLSIFTILLFIYVYIIIKDYVNNFFDNRLFATAKSVEKSIGIAHNKLFVDLTTFSIDFLSSDNKGLYYYSIIDNNGTLLIGYQGLFDENKDIKDKKFYNKLYKNSILRVVSYKNYIHSSGKSYIYYVSSGETMEEREQYINQVFFFLIIIMLIVVSFSIIITLTAVDKGLAPLHKLKKIINKRDERDLQPLHFEAPKELEDIVKSINIMLKRGRDAVNYIEKFNSDVSHQLRTPLAELKIKLDSLHEGKDKNFIVANTLIDQMSNLISQLLLYAKTSPNTLNLERFQKINLNRMCRQYGMEIAPKVYKQEFNFAFEGLNEETFIQGDTILLKSMLDNLINNALYYARDKNGSPIGTITLSLAKKDKQIYLSVKDEGYGVDERHIDKIFDRFYRVDVNKKGSGLGLSIVKQIASLHKAKTLVTNNSGLKISIIFKMGYFNKEL